MAKAWKGRVKSKTSIMQERLFDYGFNIGLRQGEEQARIEILKAFKEVIDNTIKNLPPIKPNARGGK